MVCMSSETKTRNARTKARRRMAASTHSYVSCTHAPRPGIDARSSGTSEDSKTTTLSRVDRGARVRHPTHVRTASIVHLRAGGPPPDLGVLEDAVGLDVDLRSGQLRRESRVLAFLADRERQLVVGHERPHSLAR